MITVREARVSDLGPILADCRFADMAEWFAGTGRMMYPAIHDAITTSEVARVAVDEKGPLTMWGATQGRIWMFATNRAERRAWSLHKVLGPSLAELHALYGDLHCVADVRNTTHLRWLRWLGFKELGDVDLPPFGLTFRVYDKEP